MALVREGVPRTEEDGRVTLEPGSLEGEGPEQFLEVGTLNEARTASAGGPGAEGGARHAEGDCGARDRS